MYPKIPFSDIPGAGGNCSLFVLIIIHDDLFPHVFYNFEL